jgi:hypothetical protein
MPKARPINGVTIYRGPSLRDGAPIIVVLTGLATASENDKTGAMIQSWIIREDIHPVEAVRTGQDVSICFDCKYRGDGGRDRGCYVEVWKAPANIWRSYHRGNYPTYDPVQHAPLIAGKPVRFGSYGDPAAAPIAIWQHLSELASNRTGYTHQWHTTPELREYCMASVDNPQELEAAQSMGWRTFRVTTDTDARMGEVLCPEVLKKATCATCGLCKGAALAGARSVVIAPHGFGKRAAAAATTCPASSALADLIATL